MYSIGTFSKMNRVTVKTLHHYEEIGILMPERISEPTGYRYYSSKQLTRLHHILSLRQMGLTLGEIAASLQGASLEDILYVKKNQLKDEIMDRQQKLSRIVNCIDHNGQDIDSYKMVIKELPQVIVASQRLTISDYNALFLEFPKMGEEMRRLGCVCASPPYCFTMYHDGEYKEENVDVEICEAVVTAKTDNDIVKFKTLPSIPQAVCTLHKGPYSSIRKAYAAAIEWASTNGYEVLGEARESYIDGVWNKLTEEDWLTEIQIRVTSI